VLGIWQLLSDRRVINPYIWSSLTACGCVLAPDRRGVARAGLLGLAAAVLLGIRLGRGERDLIGVFLGWYGRRGLYSILVSMLYAVACWNRAHVIGIAGIAMKSQIIIVWIGAVFPIIVNVSIGVDAIDRAICAQPELPATNRDILRGVAIPAHCPRLRGLRQGLTRVIGVVIAEYFLGNAGVGGLILNASGSGRSGEAFVGAFIFSLTALVLSRCCATSKGGFSRWR